MRSWYARFEDFKEPSCVLSSGIKNLARLRFMQTSIVSSSTRSRNLSEMSGFNAEELGRVLANAVSNFLRPTSQDNERQSSDTTPSATSSTTNAHTGTTGRATESPNAQVGIK